MNPTMDVLLRRRSIRAYEDRPVEPAVKAQILEAARRAPTAGNMMLYSIVDVTDPALKDRLAVTCDNQPFIARAPLVWLFLADYQRWFDYFLASGVEDFCRALSVPMRKPAEGDLFLACCDALIAAQNAVIAAESLGLGSCYIGDIMEQYEVHRELFDLPQYVFPICLLVFGYPTPQQKGLGRTTRFDPRFIVFENRYRRLDRGEFGEMFAEAGRKMPKGRPPEGPSNHGQAMYARKFNADFSLEMSRSVRAILKRWMA